MDAVEVSVSEDKGKPVGLYLTDETVQALKLKKSPRWQQAAKLVCSTSEARGSLRHDG